MTTTITIDTTQDKGSISRHIYGHFVSDKELLICHSEELGSEAVNATRNPAGLWVLDQFRRIPLSLRSLEMT